MQYVTASVWQSEQGKNMRSQMFTNAACSCRCVDRRVSTEANEQLQGCQACLQMHKLDTSRRTQGALRGHVQLRRNQAPNAGTSHYMKLLSTQSRAWPCMQLRLCSSTRQVLASAFCHGSAHQLQHTPNLRVRWTGISTDGASGSKCRGQRSALLNHVLFMDMVRNFDFQAAVM